MGRSDGINSPKSSLIRGGVGFKIKDEISGVMQTTINSGMFTVGSPKEADIQDSKQIKKFKERSSGAKEVSWAEYKNELSKFKLVYDKQNGGIQTMQKT